MVKGSQDEDKETLSMNVIHKVTKQQPNPSDDKHG